MSYIFGLDIDLNKNEALNFRLENQLTFPSLVTGDKGFVFFHTANEKFYGWDGTVWTELGSGGGGGDVFLATTQTFTGYKTFSGGILIDDSLAFTKRVGNITSSSQGVVYFKTDNTFNFSVGTGVGAHNATLDGIDAFTAARTFTLQDKSGTLAHLDDLSGLQTAEGTFTPTFNAFSGNDYTVSTVFSSYYRIGNMVTVRIGANGITDGASTAGRFRITGLPYSVSGTNSGSYVASYTTARGASIDFFTYSPYVSGTEINFSEHGTAATSNPLAVTWTGTTTQKALDFSITYFTTDPF